MFYDLEDKKPKNSGENWVAPNAVVIGDVTLEKNSSVWFNATLRGDIENILIGEGSNVQDGSVLHTDPGYPLKIGKNCIIGSKALITENKEIPDNSLVMGSPGKVVRQVSPEEAKLITKNAERYQDNWKRYSKSIF